MVQKLTDYLLQNPLYSYGQQQAAYGANPTPVYSPWQGLAKALQGGVGGFFQGMAMAQAKGEMEADRKNLADALQETDPVKQIAKLSERPGNADAIQSILLSKQSLANQIALAQEQQKIKMGLGGQVADSVFGGGTGGGVSTAGGGNPSGDQAQFVQTMMPHALAVSQQTGLDPRLVIAQSALETGYGRAAPGNNYFGIKGPGQTLATTEAGPNGMYATRDSFRTYPNVGASAQDYAQFIKGNQRYAPVMQAQGLDAQIEAMGKSGYATDPNYGAKLRQIAQNIPMPGGAPVGAGAGLGVGPQQAANVPQPQAGAPPPGHVMYRGVPIPNATMALAEQAMRRGDVEEGFKMLAEGAKSGAEYMRNGAELVDIRQPDGSIIKVPRNQAAGMTSAREIPLPGSKEGDINIVNDPNASPQERAQAKARLLQPQMSQGGHLLFPPDIYGGAPGQAPAPIFRDTPASNFDMEEKMRKTFAEDPAVKNYLQVKPVMEAMQAVRDYPSKAADDNLIAGVVNLYAPGTGSLPREAMFKKIGEVENIPDALKTTIRNALSSKTGMDEHSRQILLDMAQSRLTPMQREFEARVQQHTQVAKDRGIDPAHVLVLPSAPPTSNEGGAGRPEPPAGFKLVPPGG